jgi:hypothetical protein
MNIKSTTRNKATRRRLKSIFSPPKHDLFTILTQWQVHAYQGNMEKSVFIMAHITPKPRNDSFDSAECGAGKIGFRIFFAAKTGWYELYYKDF